MTHLYQRLIVSVPYHLARKYLHDALARRAELHEPTTLSLSLPVGRSALGAEVKREVVATYSAGRDPMHMDEPWKVHWTPKGGGPYPDFDGELTVRADEDYDSCALELRGDYKPPGGVAGMAFDAMVGNRIASATARELLNVLGRDVERRYEKQEAQKPYRAAD
ncbi:MAG: hypothetical protein JO193_08620 [Candidatus Eremiobacteraeota bacterium]|nr:hypothetical protein [Candidatus Eremiobacteraeota bacterium]MBV9973297.1 hypothetical protein [Candidatus Eremiobacteraeota bacterium]